MRTIMRFLQDRRAVAAVEFALVGPVMIFILFCTISAFVVERAKMKLAVAAETMAEMVAQTSTIYAIGSGTTASGASGGAPSIADFCSAAKFIMAPDNSIANSGSNMQMSITSVSYQSATPHLVITSGWSNPANTTSAASGSNAAASDCVGLDTHGAQLDGALFSNTDQAVDLSFGNGNDPNTNTVLSGGTNGTPMVNTDGSQIIVARATFVFNNPFAMLTDRSILILNALPGMRIFTETQRLVAYGYAVPAKGSVTCVGCAG